MALNLKILANKPLGYRLSVMWRGRIAQVGFSGAGHVYLPPIGKKQRYKWPLPASTNSGC